MNNPLATLYQALTQTTDLHLSDEILAEMVTAELANESLPDMYPMELTHLETCVTCASAYQELFQSTLAVITDMGEVAQQVAPLDVLSHLLTRQLSTERINIRQLIENLSFLLSTAPEEITEELVLRAVGSQTNKDQIATITKALRYHLPAFTLYLNSLANSLWGQLITISATANQQWRNLTLTLAPKRQVALLSSPELGQTWQLFRQPLGSPPLMVEAWATRLSSLACELTIRADRPGLRQVAGRAIHIIYPGQTHTLYTDTTGQVYLSAIPIAALSHLTVRVEISG